MLSPSLYGNQPGDEKTRWRFAQRQGVGVHHAHQPGACFQRSTLRKAANVEWSGNKKGTTKWDPQVGKVIKLVYNYNFTRVYGSYRPTYNVWGPHIVTAGIQLTLMEHIYVYVYVYILWFRWDLFRSNILDLTWIHNDLANMWDLQQHKLRFYHKT